MKKIIKYFCNFGGRFISYFSGNIKKITFDKVKYEKKIDVLGQEITRLNVLLFAIKEIINQSEECFEVYEQYNEFFYLTYELYHNELIHGISRLHDRSRDSLSIVRMLDYNVKNYSDGQSMREKKILDQINESSAGKKIKALRDKLGRAHLDEKVATNSEKQKRIYENNKTELKEVRQYIELLKGALEILSERLPKPLSFINPNPSIRREIRELFHKLSGIKGIK